MLQGGDEVAASVSEISTNTYFVSGNDDTGDKYQYYHAQHITDTFFKLNTRYIIYLDNGRLRYVRIWLVKYC